MVRAFATQTTTSPSLEPIMTSRNFSVDVNNNISRAVDIMWEEKVGSVMVNKDKRPYGIFTEKMFQQKYYQRKLVYRKELEIIAQMN